MSQVAEIFSGQAAIERFAACLDSFFQDDAVGKSYGIKREDGSRLLKMTPFAGCGIEDVALDVQQDVRLLHEYEMIVVDSGNSHGDSWKAVFYPKEQVLSFIQDKA